MRTECDAVVVGGGFFGCMTALELRRRCPRVVLLEQADDLLLRASYHNQARRASRLSLSAQPAHRLALAHQLSALRRTIRVLHRAELRQVLRRGPAVLEGDGPAVRQLLRAHPGADRTGSGSGSPSVQPRSRRGGFPRHRVRLRRRPPAPVATTAAARRRGRGPFSQRGRPRPRRRGRTAAADDGNSRGANRAARAARCSIALMLRSIDCWPAPVCR